MRTFDLCAHHLCASVGLCAGLFLCILPSLGARWNRHIYDPLR